MACAISPKYTTPVTCNARKSVISRRHCVQCRAVAAPAELEEVEVLKQAAKKPGSIAPSQLLKSIVSLEKKRLKPESTWESTLAAPDARWKLVYTAASKDVLAATKGTKGGSGAYFPLTAVQKFDATDQSFENGVFFGPVGHLTFKGPFLMEGKRLNFDVTTMYVGLGPWRLPITLKKSDKGLKDLPSKDLKALPFFLYAYLDEDIIVGRGRSGGLALWVRATSEWQATSGVLQVYK